MKFLRKLAMKFLIPKGFYCYDENGTCPFYRKDYRDDYYGSHCVYLNQSDEEAGIELIDQCKVCGEKEIKL